MVEGAPIDFSEIGPNAPRGEVFEHLFPGNLYSSLRRLNPRNIPSEIAEVLTHADVDAEERLRSAVRSGYGFAFRLDFAHPDKFTLYSELCIIRPTSEVAQRGWFRGAMHEGEKVGGSGVRHRTYTYVGGREQRILVNSPFDVKAVGIMKPTGEPSAIILYKEGLKSPKRGLLDSVIFLPGNLTTNPSTG